MLLVIHAPALVGSSHAIVQPMLILGKRIMHASAILELVRDRRIMYATCVDIRLCTTIARA